MFTEVFEHPLTPMEKTILSLIGQGKTSKEIADLLQRSVLTVGNHRKSICRKLNVHSTAELAACGVGAALKEQFPPLGSPCSVSLLWRMEQVEMEVTYRGHLMAKGGSARVSVGDFSFSF